MNQDKWDKLLKQDQDAILWVRAKRWPGWRKAWYAADKVGIDVMRRPA